MAKLYLGSIDLLKIDKTKLTDFVRKDGSKGVSCDVAIWVEENPDEPWKAVSLQQSTKKDDPKIYIGNAKAHVRDQGNAPQPSNQSGGNDANESDIDDLPF